MQRHALIGDGESPHLLKWARALSTRVDLWAASSRGFLPGFDEVLPAERRLALGTAPRFAGGNVGVLRVLPRLGRWLRGVDPDWIHAHYLTSHGTLAWLARSIWRLRGRMVGSAWGSDVLVAPQRSAVIRWVTKRVLRNCALTTSDSEHMARQMRVLGAREVMVFPFGLESLPALSAEKSAQLFYANRGLEAVYAPERVLAVFAHVARHWPDARLVVANDGALRDGLERQCRAQPWGSRVIFVGRLDAEQQQQHYARARWFISLPRSDSVSVSVLEAMAHGCLPILSDLPANRELVEHRRNGLIVGDDDKADVVPALDDLLLRAEPVARANRAWVETHAVFPQAVDRFLTRLQELDTRP
jgi:L-malate glycosyltransferase